VLSALDFLPGGKYSCLLLFGDAAAGKGSIENLLEFSFVPDSVQPAQDSPFDEFLMPQSPEVMDFIALSGGYFATRHSFIEQGCDPGFILNKH